MVKDPVCGMQVDEKKAGAISAYKGTTYHFCAPTCKIEIRREPREVYRQRRDPRREVTGG